MNDEQRSGLSAKIRGAWEQNQDLLRNAGSLAATTGLTSLFGFAFTVVGARSFPLTLGDGTAAINAMQLFAMIGMFGLGTMLLGELPKMNRGRGVLFSAAMSVSFIGSVVLALVFALIVGAFFGGKLPGIGGDLGQILLFVTGTALTGATLVFDEGIIGMLRGGMQLWRNMVMSAVKLAVLPVAAIVLHDKFGVGISVAFVIGTAGSLIPVFFMFARERISVFHRPDWQRMRELLPVALSHNWLNLATQVPPRVIPIVVVAVVGSKAGGVFYVIWMISALLFMVPVQLGTVLFALASASPDIVAEKLRFVLRVSLMIGLPVMLVLAVGSHFMLSFYNTPKVNFAADGTLPLILLIVGYIPQMPSAQYVAVSRANGRVNQAAGLLASFGALEVAAIFAGGKMGGLDGLSFAYLGVLLLQGLVTAPAVFRAAAIRTVQATGAFEAVGGLQQTSLDLRRLSGPLSRVTGELGKLATGAMPVISNSAEHQQSGLAALFAIASAAVASEGNTMNVATQIWKTGTFPTLPAAATRPRRAPHAATSLDVYGGGPQGAATSLDMFGHMAAKSSRAPGQGGGAVPSPDAPMKGEATRIVPVQPLPVPGRPLPPPGGGEPTAPAPQAPVNYRRRQQAGVDALIAIATPVVADDRQEAEAGG
jgi:O-antigen/teichoic acid export membrane protein